MRGNMVGQAVVVVVVVVEVVVVMVRVVASGDGVRGSLSMLVGPYNRCMAATSLGDMEKLGV